mmetsp:Transcript_29434/g.70569  ORF Transcript_29434/g.70569 Transcript_29434/m.70569 type:complete len:282 (-) Transcript_29434:673-1518(-)
MQPLRWSCINADALRGATHRPPQRSRTIRLPGRKPVCCRLDNLRGTLAVPSDLGTRPPSPHRLSEDGVTISVVHQEGLGMGLPVPRQRNPPDLYRIATNDLAIVMVQRARASSGEGTPRFFGTHRAASRGAIRRGPHGVVGGVCRRRRRRQGAVVRRTPQPKQDGVVGRRPQHPDRIRRRLVVGPDLRQAQRFHRGQVPHRAGRSDAFQGNCVPTVVVSAVLEFNFSVKHIGGCGSDETQVHQFLGAVTEGSHQRLARVVHVTANRLHSSGQNQRARERQH